MSVRITRRGRRIATILVIIAGFAGGYASGHHNATPNPRPCHIGHNTMASGDAGMGDGREYVCTDGWMIPVRGYGY
jgi:hypothetical protein